MLRILGSVGFRCNKKIAFFVLSLIKQTFLMILMFFSITLEQTLNKKFVEKEYQNAFADHFLQIFCVTLIFSFKNEG